jgi:hypothetical protein
VLLRWSGKWLPARVREDGKRTFPDEGSPPGGVLTPQTILQKSSSCSI